MASEIGWDRPLRYRRGSPTRLDGVDIYFDFEWLDVFSDGRAQFRNGQCLAQLVRNDCPQGKVPALLLTTRDDVEERSIETDSRFVVVLNLPRYLAHATPDAAASYYAHRLDSGITSIAKLHKLVAQPAVIQAVVDKELTVDHINAWVGEDPDRIEEVARIPGVRDAVELAHGEFDVEKIAAWAAGNEKRIDQLRRIAGEHEPEGPTATFGAVVAALETLDDLDEEIVNAIESLLGPKADRDAKLRFLRALTADPTGRFATSEVLGERIGERLEDARAITAEYEALLAAPHASETALQRFIEANPWLLGLDYVQVRPRRPVPRGQVDFILERYDGFHDVLELKSPQDPIILAPDAVDGVPPAASAFALSPDLAQAMAQIHVYRDILSTDALTVDKLYGIENSRDPSVLIVIGQARLLPSHRARVLRDLNLSLHRVEIVPYDVLADRASAVLDNVELYLSESSRQTYEPTI
jgi:hypothetical protein